MITQKDDAIYSDDERQEKQTPLDDRRIVVRVVCHYSYGSLVDDLVFGVFDDSNCRTRTVVG
jgi:hypothetical protein